MNVVRIVFRKRVLAGLFCTALAACAVGYALAPHEISVVFDQKIAEGYRSSIRKCAEKSFLQSQLVDMVMADMQNKCPSVAALDVRYTSSLVAHVMVKASVPIVRIASLTGIHKEYVVCATGELIEKKYFSEAALAGLPVLYIAGTDYEEKKTDPECRACAREMDSALFEEFTVTWHSKSEIILRSNSSKERMVLIADSTTVHDEEKRVYARRILHIHSDRYKNGIKVDMRLRDSLVCSAL
ncbi:hypothetical protein H0W26_00650 [Candidatus Dependentiae bacterium]|nr:hypothetical protein [Candidatus Dependentiae bacterium]